MEFLKLVLDIKFSLFKHNLGLGIFCLSGVLRVLRDGVPYKYHTRPAVAGKPEAVRKTIMGKNTGKAPAYELNNYFAQSQLLLLTISTITSTFGVS